MQIQVFRNENSSQTNAYSHYSSYSYSGLIPNERALRDTLGNITQHYSLNYEHFKTAELEAKGVSKILTKKSFKTIGHSVA